MKTTQKKAVKDKDEPQEQDGSTNFESEEEAERDLIKLYKKYKALKYQRKKTTQKKVVTDKDEHQEQDSNNNSESEEETEISHVRKYIKICERCGKLMKKTDLPRHMREVHYGKDRGKCETCGKLMLKVCLPRHIKEVHQKRKIKRIKRECKICGKLTFKRRLHALINHFSEDIYTALLTMLECTGGSCSLCGESLPLRIEGWKKKDKRKGTFDYRGGKSLLKHFSKKHELTLTEGLVFSDNKLNQKNVDLLLDVLFPS